MNISANLMANSGMNVKVLCKTPKKDEKKKTAEKSYEQALIDDFKEKNSGVNKRIEQIFGKFRAGKELNSEELEYLAKNRPEMYKEVKEVMQERRMMEIQMKLAKTKQQVAAVNMNQLTRIKNTMGTGEEAERQAQKTMARTNQTASAYIKFTASVEYKEKEDEKTQAEDRREKLRELEEQYEEQAEKIQESDEDTLEPVEKENSEDGVQSEEKTMEAMRDAAEFLEKQERKKETKTHKKREEEYPVVPQSGLDVDNKVLWMKVKKLYQVTGEKKESTRSNGLDLSL